MRSDMPQQRQRRFVSIIIDGSLRLRSQLRTAAPATVPTLCTIREGHHGSRSGSANRHHTRRIHHSDRAGAATLAGPAIVLSGGGTKGDFEVGAVRCLYEQGILPNILCGTSVGSVNALKLAEGEDHRVRGGRSRPDFAATPARPCARSGWPGSDLAGSEKRPGHVDA